jgi:hypothetical protein
MSGHAAASEQGQRESAFEEAQRLLEEVPLPVGVYRVKPPGTSRVARLISVVGAVVWFALLLYFSLEHVPSLAADLAARGRARPVLGAKVEGTCSADKLYTSCDLRIAWQPPGGGMISRELLYGFVDLFPDKRDTIEVVVVADPERPDRITTDLGLAKLWNRVFSFLLLLAIPTVVFGFAVLAAIIESGEARRLREILSSRTLRPVVFQLVHRQPKLWQVRRFDLGSQGEVSQWDARFVEPLVIDDARGLLLGLATEDDGAELPLDDALKWLEVPEERKVALQDWAARARIRAAPPGAGDPFLGGRFRKSRRMALGLGGLCALLLGMWAVGDAKLNAGPDPREYQFVDYLHGLEPTGKVVSFSAELLLTARVTALGPGGQATIYTPLSGLGWKPDRPIRFLLEGLPQYPGSGSQTMAYGTLHPGIPAEVRKALVAKELLVAPDAQTLRQTKFLDPSYRDAWMAMKMVGQIWGAFVLPIGVFFTWRALRLSARLRRVSAVAR